MGALQAQQLTAPEAAVRPQADPVQGQAEQRGLHAVFRTDGGDVGVVVGDAVGGHLEALGQFQRQAGGGQVRVQVVGNGGGLHRQGGEQVGHGFFEKAQGGGVVQAADVLGEKSGPAPGQADGVFQVSTQGQHVRAVVAQGNGFRRETRARRMKGPCAAIRLSSQRTTMSRSCSQQASAMPASRSRAS